MKFLIAGLGNIGSDYDGTRHNIGFDVVDALAKEFDATFELERHAFYTNFKSRGKQFHIIKPTTYMNLSGKAVRYWLSELSIPQSNLLVIIDDLALPYGKLRMRAKGSDGGHNGLKDINTCLGSNQYARLRFGIGDEFRKGKQVDYVLGKWNVEELEEIETLITKATVMVKSFAFVGLARTMNQFND